MTSGGCRYVDLRTWNTRTTLGEPHDNGSSPALTESSGDTEGQTAPSGVNVRKLFVSYARGNKRDIDQLVDHLGIVGYQTWVDTSLRGGQDWWQEILGRIADCDVFIAIISREALSSTACKRELDWAEALGKPVLPVAVEPPPSALPRRFSMRQIIDYSDLESRDRAALALAGGLAALRAAPPLPDPLPDAPQAPLSYLTDPIDQVAQADSLDHEKQRQIVSRLESALRSVDREERQGGRDIMDRFRSREDLYADVDRALNQLVQVSPASSERLSAEDVSSRQDSAKTACEWQ
jgi:hypothetical protein